MRVALIVLIVLLGYSTGSGIAELWREFHGAGAKGGFVLAEALVPVEQILPGGPPVDGIPALINPRFLEASQADYLRPDDRVLAFAYGGEAKAYPIKILNWHEVVNDTVGGLPVVVSYCPLCGSGMVFHRPAGVSSFGVSGLLYNSDVLLYDRDTRSLWSQIMMKAISGQFRGQPLQLLAAQHTSWRQWMTLYPQSLVLSRDTGHWRDYDRDLYQNYRQSSQLYFPVSNHSSALSPKAWVLGVKYRSLLKAYPFSLLDSANGPIEELVEGELLRIDWHAGSRSAEVINGDGETVPSTAMYWFAWYGFYPQTEIYGSR